MALDRDPDGSESFAAFKDPFSYGSRTDPDFKFLKRLDAPAAAAFFDDLLAAVGDAFDHGDASPIIDLVIERQAAAYARQLGEGTRFAYPDGPFAESRRPVAEEMRLPRVVVTRHPMGRLIGAPGDAEGQDRLVRRALRLVDEGTGQETVVEWPEPYRPRRGAGP